MDEGVWISAVSKPGDEALWYMQWAWERDCPFSDAVEFECKHIDREDLIKWFADKGLMEEEMQDSAHETLPETDDEETEEEEEEE